MNFPRIKIANLKYCAKFALTMALAFLPVGLFPLPAAALETGWEGEQRSQMRLIAARVNFRGKMRLIVGIEIRLAPKWKTYWRAPGDSGIPPDFDWSGSLNLEKAEILYPVPLRFKDSAGTSIGYKSRVILPVLLTPKQHGRPITLKLKAEYAICYNLCVPISSEQTLKIVDTAASRYGPAIEAAAAKLPQPVSEANSEFGVQKVIGEIEGKTPRLRFVVQFPASSVSRDVFVEGQDNLYVPLTKPVDGAIKANQQMFEVDLLQISDDPKVFKNAELICTVRADDAAIVQPCKVE